MNRTRKMCENIPILMKQLIDEKTNEVATDKSSTTCDNDITCHVLLLCFLY